ncbi:MAG: RidA family protein [Gemmatimonadota bacterium]|nr:RidA family protein [Gemmatimonadota bacterium]MDH3422758.1 RidA family protein [Gemmatimonadota bacterium]
MRRRVRGLVTLGVLWMVVGCTIEQRTDREPQTSQSTRRQVIQPEGVARLPVFSSAIRSGDLIFLSGQLGALPGVTPPQLVEGGVEPETRQTMENIITVLDAAGATLDDLIKCTVFLADIADYAAVNTVYQEYFPNDPPARSALAGSGLALGALVEIECIAAAPSGG